MSMKSSSAKDSLATWLSLAERRWLAPACLGAWVLVLVLVPDPRPLSAPEWIVRALHGLSGAPEPTVRFVATVGLRLAGFAALGALLMWALGAERWNGRGLAGVLLAPLASIGLLWANLGYFPIAAQLQLAALAGVVGAVARIALNRSPLTGVGIVVALGALFAWGASTGIGDGLDAATRKVAQRVLARADEAPDGDDGFVKLLELAFESATDEAAPDDPVEANRAAILALSVILGEEKVAAVASRRIDAKRRPQVRALQGRITVHGRKDWSQHFWVSAGLTLLSDKERSLAVGLSKELMDSTSGGSGFSFADLAADASGNRFTLAATRDPDSARAMQTRVRAGARVADFVPDLRDLPEGLSSQQFQERFGGLGGAETQRVVDEIVRRLSNCPGLE